VRASRHSASKFHPASGPLGTLWLLFLLGAALSGCGAGSSSRGSDDKESRATAQPTLFRIRGQVRLSDSADPTGTQVFCAGTSYCAFADAEGNYTISGVPKGTYLLVAQKPGYLTARADDVALDGGSQRQNLEVTVETMELSVAETAQSPAKALAGGLTGWVRVTGSDASPEGVRVSLAGTLYTTSVGSNGLFLLEKIVPGDYTVEFTRGGSASVSVPARVLPGQITRLPDTIEMSATTTAAPTTSLSILGTLMFLTTSGETAQPVPGATVQIVQTRQQAEVHGDGSFELTNLTPGAYTLTATAPGFALNNTVEIRISTESQTAVLVMREKTTEEPEGDPGDITGIVELRGATPKTKAGVQVALAGTSHSGVTDANGEFTLTDVPQGTGTLVCTLAGYKTLETANVEIVAGQVTDIGTLTMEPDTEAPKVLSSDPGDGATGIVIRPTVPIRLVLSKKMRLETVREALSVEPACDFTVTRRGQGDDKRDILEVAISSENPAGALKFLTTYRLTVGTGATDTEGLSLEEPFTMSFKTAGLRILSSSPEDGTQDFSAVTSTALTFRFNGAVKKETLIQRNVTFMPTPPSLNPNWDIIQDPKTGWTSVRIPLLLKTSTSYVVRFNSRIAAEDGTRLDDASTRLRFRTAAPPQYK
jgi:hypothetical protein